VPGEAGSVLDRSVVMHCVRLAVARSPANRGLRYGVCRRWDAFEILAPLARS
jgi:hypothetical protein